VLFGKIDLKPLIQRLYAYERKEIQIKQYGAEKARILNGEEEREGWQAQQRRCM
jgi:hypothetical protein